MSDCSLYFQSLGYVVKKLVTVAAAIASFGFVNSANAADMPVKAPVAVASTNWTGFYIGANAGWSWLKNDDVGIGGSALILAAQPVTVPFSVGIKPTGFLGGIQAGYNYQFAPQWLAGIEADIDAANIRASADVGLPAGGPLVVTSASEKIKWFGTVRGRLGWLPSQNLLLFGTGGLAYGDVAYTANINEIGGRQFNASSDRTKAGWTLGAGAEWAFMRNWSVKAEYLYFDLGSTTITGPQTNPVLATQFATYAFKTRGSIARVGVNFRFGP